MGYKKEDKEVSDIIIKEFSILPIIYNGDINIIIKTIKKLKLKFPKYNNFITNYFIENKLTYFKENSLNYSIIPDDFRTNTYLENYNGFIKSLTLLLILILLKIIILLIKIYII